MVGSAKGGVGKSTTAVNLALALQEKLGPDSVALLDADVHGPSLPILMGIEAGTRPDLSGVVGQDGKPWMAPLENYGLPVMSMGFLADPSTAMVWRGPMVMGALNQLLHKTHWGKKRVLVVDMPPGTGDAQITLAQTSDVKVAGIVMVSTPQEVALGDVRRGVAMFRKVSVPVLGLVENMGAYVCPSCGDVSHPFGADGGPRAARDLDLPFFGTVPLDPALRAASDLGVPLMTRDDVDGSPVVEAYRSIADQVVGLLDQADEDAGDGDGDGEAGGGPVITMG